MAVIRVGELTVNFADAVPSLTPVAPVKSEPVIATCWSARPAVGEKPVILGGGGVTVNADELVAVPLGVVTEIGPVVAPLDTVAVMLVGELTV